VPVIVVIFFPVVIVTGGSVGWTESIEHDEKAHGNREAQEIQHRKAVGHKDRRRRRFGHADRRHPREFSRFNSFPSFSCLINYF